MMPYISLSKLLSSLTLYDRYFSVSAREVCFALAHVCIVFNGINMLQCIYILLYLWTLAMWSILCQFFVTSNNAAVNILWTHILIILL